MPKMRAKVRVSSSNVLSENYEDLLMLPVSRSHYGSDGGVEELELSFSWGFGRD